MANRHQSTTKRQKTIRMKKLMHKHTKRKNAQQSRNDRKYSKKVEKNFRKKKKNPGSRMLLYTQSTEEVCDIAASKLCKLENIRKITNKKPLSAFIHRFNVLNAQLMQKPKSDELDSTQKSVLVDELLNFLGHQITSLYSKPPLCRGLQSALKYGNTEQRLYIWGKFKGIFTDVVINKYAHNLVIKLYLYGNEDIRKDIRKLLSENTELFFSKYGAIVWEYVYTSDISSSKRRHMLFSIVIPRIVYIKIENLLEHKNIYSVFQNLDSETRKHFIDNICKIIQRIVDKELLDKSAVHTILKYYTQCCDVKQMEDCFSKIEDGSIHLITTKDGVEALCRMLGYANSRSRRKFIKVIKSKICEATCNVVDYLLVMRLNCIVDDTKLLNDCIVKEISKMLIPICFNQYGHKPILNILSNSNDCHLMNSYESYILSMPSPMSLKDEDKRKLELQGYLIPEIRNALSCSKSISDWITDPWAKNILVSYLSLTGDSDVASRIIREIEMEVEGEESIFLLDHQIGHRTIINLLNLKIRNDFKNSNYTTDHTLVFAYALWETIKDKIELLLKLRSVFVLTDIFKFSQSPENIFDSFSNEVKQMLSVKKIDKARKEIQKAGNYAGQ